MTSGFARNTFGVKRTPEGIAAMSALVQIGHLPGAHECLLSGEVDMTMAALMQGFDRL